jgi:hypothetical protein
MFSNFFVDIIKISLTIGVDIIIPSKVFAKYNVSLQNMYA